MGTPSVWAGKEAGPSPRRARFIVKSRVDAFPTPVWSSTVPTNLSGPFILMIPGISTHTKLAFIVILVFALLQLSNAVKTARASITTNNDLVRVFLAPRIFS